MLEVEAESSLLFGRLQVFIIIEQSRLAILINCLVNSSIGSLKRT